MIVWKLFPCYYVLVIDKSKEKVKAALFVIDFKVIMNRKYVKTIVASPDLSGFQNLTGIFCNSDNMYECC